MRPPHNTQEPEFFQHQSDVQSQFFILVKKTRFVIYKGDGNTYGKMDLHKCNGDNNFSEFVEFWDRNIYRH